MRLFQVPLDTCLGSPLFASLSVHGFPRGPGEASKRREAKIAAREFLPLNWRAIALTAGVISKEDNMPSLVGERQFWEAF